MSRALQTPEPCLKGPLSSPFGLSTTLPVGTAVVYLDPQLGQLYTSQTACMPWETLSGAWWVRLEGLAEPVLLRRLLAVPRPIAERPADQLRCPPLSSVSEWLFDPVCLPF